MSIKDIALLLDEKPRNVEDVLRQLEKTLRNIPYRIQVEPTRCNKCDFMFHKDKLHKSGKCPIATVPGSANR